MIMLIGYRISSISNVCKVLQSVFAVGEICFMRVSKQRDTKNNLDIHAINLLYSSKYKDFC